MVKGVGRGRSKHKQPGGQGQQRQQQTLTPAAAIVGVQRSRERSGVADTAESLGVDQPNASFMTEDPSTNTQDLQTKLEKRRSRVRRTSMRDYPTNC
jgi:hypothetical protein